MVQQGYRVIQTEILEHFELYLSLDLKLKYIPEILIPVKNICLAKTIQFGFDLN